MAITTFAELKTAISSWAEVNDVDAYLDDVVSLSTDVFNYGLSDMPPLRTREMMAVESLSPADGACTLPDDYLQYRRVVEEASCRRNLQYIAMTSVEQMYAARESGLSSTFTIVDDQLYMFPLSSNDIELTYFQKIPHLTDAATTNWLLTKHPGIYLHAGLYQLGILRRDDGLAQRSMMILNGLVRGLSRANFSSEFARATTRLRVAP
jgi:hypothetical protein